VQICGIDEAGRGSMLGPLVIAGISLEKKNLRKLTSLGVKDSKKTLLQNLVKFFIKKIIENC
jgi:RNase HII (EC 3.1.26.4)